MDLSPDEFWGLSWYEYDLYLLKQDKDQDKDKFQWETGWDMTRILWSTFHNAHFKPHRKPTDLIKLSFDKPEKPKDDKPMTPVEMKQMLGGKFMKNGE